jgi:hypothetical protein
LTIKCSDKSDPINAFKLAKQLETSIELLCNPLCNSMILESTTIKAYSCALIESISNQSHILNPFGGRQYLFAEDPQRFFVVATLLHDFGDLTHRQSQLSYVAQSLVDRKFLLAANPQRLFDGASLLQDVGDLAHR